MTATREAQAVPVRPGIQFPLGATVQDGGTNFAVAAAGAGAMTLCLFDAHGAETQVPLTENDAGVWHGFVPGAGAGQACGYRAAGRYDPGAGLRFNPAKLLIGMRDFWRSHPTGIGEFASRFAGSRTCTAAGTAARPPR